MKFDRTNLSAGIGFAVAALSLFLVGYSMQKGDGMRGPNRESSSYATGKKVYIKYCADCHGEDGGGNGPDAHLMKIKPTDFRTGVYRFKSTPGSALPRKSDIVRTLELGVTTTAMLPQLQLNRSEMEDVAGYVMDFCGKFGKEKPAKVVAVPPAPRRTEAMVKGGKKLFDATCSVCHGTNAEGDGPIAGTLKDYKGRPIRPANLTERPLPRANSPKALYMRIATGINGTPMGSFAGAFKPNQLWSIVYYLESAVKVNLAKSSKGSSMMGRSGMMGGKRMMKNGTMMGPRLVGEEAIGARIDPAAYRAWMMSERK